MSLTDSDLIARVLLDDDHHAFAELVRRHQSAVRGMMRRLTRGNAVLADELAHETFLKVYGSLRSFRGDAKFTTWLFRIAYNVYYSERRRAKPHESLDEQSADFVAEPQVQKVDLQHDVEEAMKVLTDDERAAITLCYTAGMTHQEAAEALQCPLGTVKTHISTGKEKMRRYLSPWRDRIAT